MTVHARLAGEPRIYDLAQEVFDDVSARSAIVQRAAIALQRREQHGISESLDEDFWRGVEALMRANRDDLQRLEDAIRAGDGDRS